MPADVGDTDAAVAALVARGWAVWSGYLDPRTVADLHDDSRTLWRQGRFRHAGVGRGADFQVRPDVRGDRLLWLDPAQAGERLGVHLQRMDNLRRALNEALFLGLRDFEAHLSVYPVGACYRAHLDHFRNAAHRVVSSVLYLNDGDWGSGDGGQLRLYTDGHARAEHVDVLPLGGRLVLFMSQRFWHEVLPARRERWSLTGWFTRRP